MSDRLSRRITGRHGPVTPGNQGRFGPFDSLQEVDHWDLVTAGVVLARLEPDPELHFFTRDEEPTVRALLDLLLGQHQEPRVPVTELVDQRLVAGETDGWRYEDMPEDGEAWRRSLAALDAESRSRHGRRFCELSLRQRGALVQWIHDGDQWRGFNTSHLWSLWTRYGCAAFYSHPWAWNEMGFGGPAYPRGYQNLGVDKRERWEQRDQQGSDPVPWAQRVEATKKAHAARGGAADRGGGDAGTLIGPGPGGDRGDER